MNNDMDKMLKAFKEYCPAESKLLMGGPTKKGWGDAALIWTGFKMAYIALGLFKEYDTRD